MAELSEENINNVHGSETYLNTQTNYDELEIQIETLNKQKLELVDAKRYPEAEIIKNQIINLQAKLNKKKIVDLTSQHNNELKMLEDKYNQEYNFFNEEWTEKLAKFEEETKAMEDNMNQKQSKELEELENSINSSTKSIKFSTQYQQLAIAEASLVKQQKYDEAHVVILKKQALEKIETEKYNKEVNEKNRKKLEKMQKKHDLEKSTFKKKIEIELEMLQKTKDTQLAKLNYKYKVRRNVLDIQHQQEKKLSENEKLMRQKAIANDIRIKGTKSNFLNESKYGKSSEKKVLKTEIDISADMQNSSINDK